MAINFKEKLTRVEAFVFDVDGVFTDGQIVPTVGVGISPTLCKLAKTVIVELNSWHPKELRGMHDLTQIADPPHRHDSGVTGVRDRLGKDHILVDPAKIVVVEVNEPNEGSVFAPVDEVTHTIGENVARFFVAEMKAGRIPASFLPIQSGVGNIANAVLAALAENSDIPDLEVYTEVIQDAVIDMLESGVVRRSPFRTPAWTASTPSSRFLRSGFCCAPQSSRIIPK